MKGQESQSVGVGVQAKSLTSSRLMKSLKPQCLQWRIQREGVGIILS